MIKTFRGLIVDGGQDTIVLHTNDGATGYRIVKFQLIPNIPAAASAEHVVKVFKTEQTTIDGTVDFSDNTLLAAGFTNNYSDAMAYPLQQYTIFDKEIFNQDIYVTHKDVATGQLCNYYIELEQVKLDLSESTVATLKDVRNTALPAQI
ncbi:MAG TPA: hypothetical protein EYN67_14825 [Flavobacteriales bacterium]|nr:hypothetical protein [Flavobacteriales bacterium]